MARGMLGNAVQFVTVTLLISMTLILVIETCVFVSKLQFQVYVTILTLFDIIATLFLITSTVFYNCRYLFLIIIFISLYYSV